MERSGDLVDGGAGCGQHQLGALHPNEPDVTADAAPHLQLEFSGKVVL